MKYDLKYMYIYVCVCTYGVTKLLDLFT